MKSSYYVAGTSVYKIKPKSEENTFKVVRYEKKTVVNAIQFLRIFLILFVVLFFLGYVNLQASINTKKENVSSLEEEIMVLKTENNAIESRIKSENPSITEVKRRAESLNMNLATDSQIVYYEVSPADGMRVYY